MSVARVYSAQPHLLDADIVTIEADLSRGLHSFSVVGLPDKAVEEARDRISAAIKHSGFSSPKSKNHKIVISLAPADLKKEGPLFDLAMALSYLLAGEEIAFDPTGKLFVGELSLDGELRPVRGILSITAHAAEKGITEIFVPKANAKEAALVRGIRVFAAHSLSEILGHIDQKRETRHALSPEVETTYVEEETVPVVRLEDIRGQESAKRGLMIAASGRHNILMAGPPGTGKTMLARALEGILPPLEYDEALEVTAIHSVAGILDTPIVSMPPFRAPHHTSSYTSLVGGGTHPRPGEVTLAHRGVLFLDEFPEFERRCIDALRQPLEDRKVRIARVQATATFPADFMLIAAMNPHRGGNVEGRVDEQVSDQYRKKISGPILDRIDLWLEVTHVPYETLTATGTKPEETREVRERIKNARIFQKKRFGESGPRTNAEMSSKDIDTFITLSDTVRTVLHQSAEKLGLSPRSFHRVIKVARTIADLDEKNDIGIEHVLEALQYRVKL